MVIKESSITNEEVKKVKVKTANLKFDVKSHSNISSRAFKTYSYAMFKNKVKSHPINSKGILGASCTPMK